MGPSEAKGHKGRRNSLHHCDVGKKAELRRKSKACDTKNLIYIYRLGKAERKQTRILTRTSPKKTANEDHL